MTTLTIYSIAFAGTLLLLLLLIPLAPRWKLMDHPGGRKHHLGKTPVVGGLSIGFMFVAALLVFQPQAWQGSVIAILTLLTLGILDDRHDLSPIPKLLTQAGVVLLMFYAADVKLMMVGNLIGYGSIGTWVFAPIVTTVAVIGVINAINMADGIDGHAGFMSLIAFTAYAYVARESALWDQYKLLLALAGGVTAFLLLNARAPWLNHARTFLGDAGSMVLGFVIAWFAVDLTQGDGRSFPPICALWVIAIPLCDCVSLMIRRRSTGGSMFAADRQHLHHYLLTRGLSVGQATIASAVGSLVCAAVAVLGWKLLIPEYVLFACLVAFFTGYHLHMRRVFRASRVHPMSTGPALVEIPVN